MHDDSSAVISSTDYARIHEEQQPRLVAYARSLARNAWAAEDLVAEAHFRVWRRLAEGHEIDNVSAYLMTTVRHLACAAGGAVRETPRDPHADEQAEAGRHGDDPADPTSAAPLVTTDPQPDPAQPVDGACAPPSPDGDRHGRPRR